MSQSPEPYPHLGLLMTILWPASTGAHVCNNKVHADKLAGAAGSLAQLGKSGAQKQTLAHCQTWFHV